MLSPSLQVPKLSNLALLVLVHYVYL